MNENKTLRYVLLPPTNAWNLNSPGTGASFLLSASVPQKRIKRVPSSLRGSSDKKASRPAMTVLDSLGADDAKLVAMTDKQRLRLHAEEPGVRVVPVVEAHPLWMRERLRSTMATPSGVSIPRQFEVLVTDAVSGRPVRQVQVTAFLSLKELSGQKNTTNAKGIAKFRFPGSTRKLDAILADALHTYWPMHISSVKLEDGQRFTLVLPPLELAFSDCRLFFNGEGSDADGKGVRVAVIDCGVSKHKDLVFTPGVNTARGERANQTQDNGLGHGTHVAGIIAGRGKHGEGVRGIAPGVEMVAYRVYAKGSDSAESFAIAKAVRQAVDDGCDLINLSLGSRQEMEDVLREIRRARAKGVLCIAASGNDNRGPVNFPAAYSEVVAVSAMGRKGCFPSGAAQELDIGTPPGRDRKDFVGTFSNMGPQVDLIGPGVGIISTYPGGYAVMDGTSMAAPAVTGAVAKLLGKAPGVLRMSAGQERSDKIAQLALKAAKSMGFNAKLEGAGHIS